MAALPKELYEVEQIRELERIAIEDLRISQDTLMLRAGTAAFGHLCEVWPDAKAITVLCGHGNNGGDGYVLARLAKQQGLSVHVLHMGSLENLKSPALEAAQACQEAGVNMKALHKDSLLQGDVLVDALLGIGLQHELDSDYLAVINAINNSKIPVLAIDVPSGMNADTGRIHGAAVKAYTTVTFIGLKQGLFTGQGQAFCGYTRFANLEMPESAYNRVKPSAVRLHLTKLREHLLLPRSRDSHKGHFGHVLIIGGDYGMAGAVKMAAEAAYRVGAGLVSVATRPEHIAIVSSTRPEIMCHEVQAKADLHVLLKTATVIVIGPGLGRSGWARELFATVINSLHHHPKPILLDADALNILANTGGSLDFDNWVLTPHPGEAGRLLSCFAHEVQGNRFSAVKSLRKKFGGVCVLKGAGTLISGDGDNSQIWLCNDGNPGMATGGMGDILSGVIGGLIAQGLSLLDAAKLGVALHAKAGDSAAEQGGERGLIATDLMPQLRLLVN